MLLPGRINEVDILWPPARRWLTLVGRRKWTSSPTFINNFTFWWRRDHCVKKNVNHMSVHEDSYIPVWNEAGQFMESNLQQCLQEPLLRFHWWTERGKSTKEGSSAGFVYSKDLVENVDPVNCSTELTVSSMNQLNRKFVKIYWSKSHSVRMEWRAPAGNGWNLTSQSSLNKLFLQNLNFDLNFFQFWEIYCKLCSLVSLIPRHFPNIDALIYLSHSHLIRNLQLWCTWP